MADPPHAAIPDAPPVQDLARFVRPPDFLGRAVWWVQLWWLVQATLFGLSPQAAFGWRRLLLRLFGARIGPAARIRPSVRCVFPWRLSVGEWAWIGDRVTLYSVDRIEIGAHAVVSHGSTICTADHDPDDPSFAVRRAPVRIGREVWLASEVFVAPGVSVGDGAVLGVRALALHDVPARTIAYGQPARPARPRGVDTAVAPPKRPVRTAGR